MAECSHAYSTYYRAFFMPRDSYFLQILNNGNELAFDFQMISAIGSERNTLKCVFDHLFTPYFH